jgi:sulfate adenylyltransferase large subunit
VEQSRRHSFIATLLRIPHVVLAVNKMDLVDYDQEVFDRIRQEYADFASRLDVPDLTFIPMSALHGDNVVERSANMEWYKGATLLHHLEEVHIASDRNMVDVRFPVQYVIRPQSSDHPDFRGYAGTVSGGVMKPGDEIAVLPSGFTSRIRSIIGPQGEVEEAYAPMAVTVLLEDELDVSRGDMICRVNNQPAATQDLEAMVCWMSESLQLTPGAKLGIKHTTNWARALVKDFRYRLDINTLHRDPDATSLGLNEIGRVRLRTTQPLFADPYRRNRSTGSFILVDETSNVTVGAGMIRETE